MICRPARLLTWVNSISEKPSLPMPGTMSWFGSSGRLGKSNGLLPTLPTGSDGTSPGRLAYGSGAVGFFGCHRDVSRCTGGSPGRH
eukprot:7387444-Prymnesium_polylepis.2